MAVILVVIKFGQRQGVFVKARWAALVRPVELLARAEVLLELEPGAGGLRLPCTQKKSQAGKGQEARAARWIQRPGLLPRRQMLCSFFYFQNPPMAKIAASS
jgi:hypothetical protein